MVGEADTNYDMWETSLPDPIKTDPLWRQRAYRLALFAAHLGWEDATRLARDLRTRGLADQLLRAVGSIGANIAEGYSRGTGADRARLYEYALGSARESRHWYCTVVPVLGSRVVRTRVDLWIS